MAKENIKNFENSICKKGCSISRVVNLNIQIMAHKSHVDILKLKIGNLIYNNKADINDSEVQKVIKTIDEENAIIEEKKQELKKLYSEL